MVGLMGPAGSGQLTKMVNQICIAGLVQGLAEGIHFGRKAGLDVEKVIEVISKGAAGSWQMENRHKTMISCKYDFGFAVDWMRKDLDICSRKPTATAHGFLSPRLWTSSMRTCRGWGAIAGIRLRCSRGSKNRKRCGDALPFACMECRPGHGASTVAREGGKPCRHGAFWHRTQTALGIPNAVCARLTGEKSATMSAL